MPNARRLRPRVFLEGIEVPCSRVSFGTQRGDAAFAQVELVPLSTIKHLEPRTLVHIFVEDPYEPLSESKQEITVGKETRKLFNWFLAFEGEYYAKSYGKSVNNRYFMAQAIDYTSYWDNAKSYFFDATMAANLGDSIAAQPDSTEQVLERQSLQKTYNETPTAVGSRSWLAAQFKKTLAEGGDFAACVKEVFKQIANGNQFLRLAESRMRISDRIVNLTAGKGLLDLLNQEAMASLAESMAGQAEGGVKSLRDVLNSVLQFIFYDVTCMVNPSKVAAETDYLYPLVVNGQKLKISEYIIKPNLYFLPPPRCNVLFPSMYSDFSHSHDYFHEPTRLAYRPSLSAYGDDAKVTQQFVYYPPTVNNFMAQVENEAKTPWEESEDFDVTPLFGDEYAARIASRKYNQEDNPREPVTNRQVSTRLRMNDFLTQEESIRGINRIDMNLFPGVDNLRQYVTDEEFESYFRQIAEYLFFKQRFEHRKFSVTTSYNPHVAVGFPILLLDDGEADQNIIGYLDGVQHNITTQSAATTLMVSYGREVLELKDGEIFEPPIPPWFDPKVWGEGNRAKAAAEARQIAKEANETGDTLAILTAELDEGKKVQEAQAEAALSGANVFGDVDSAYQSALGVNSILIVGGQSERRTLVGATKRLLAEYREVKKKPNPEEAEKKFVSNYIRRPLVTMMEAFNFIDANYAVGTDLDELIRFVSSRKGARGIARFDGKFAGSPNVEDDKTKLFGLGFEYLDDSRQIERKRYVVEKYVKELKRSRGKKG